MKQCPNDIWISLYFHPCYIIPLIFKNQHSNIQIDSNIPSLSNASEPVTCVSIVQSIHPRNYFQTWVQHWPTFFQRQAIESLVPRIRETHRTQERKKESSPALEHRAESRVGQRYRRRDAIRSIQATGRLGSKPGHQPLCLPPVTLLRNLAPDGRREEPPSISRIRSRRSSTAGATTSPRQKFGSGASGCETSRNLCRAFRNYRRRQDDNTEGWSPVSVVADLSRQHLSRY